MPLHADKADYNHWNRQMPSKPIIHSQGFFNQSETVLIVFPAKCGVLNPHSAQYLKFFGRNVYKLPYISPGINI